MFMSFYICATTRVYPETVGGFSCEYTPTNAITRKEAKKDDKFFFVIRVAELGAMSKSQKCDR